MSEGRVYDLSVCRCDCDTCQSDMDCCEHDEDPGPHACVYVGVDDHDECEICGRLANQFSDLGYEWDIDWDGSAA